MSETACSHMHVYAQQHEHMRHRSVCLVAMVTHNSVHLQITFDNLDFLAQAQMRVYMIENQCSKS